MIVKVIIVLIEHRFFLVCCVTLMLIVSVCELCWYAYPCVNFFLSGNCDHPEPRTHSSPPQRPNEITAWDKQAADIPVDENMRLVFSLDVYVDDSEEVVRVSCVCSWERERERERERGKVGIKVRAGKGQEGERGRKERRDGMREEVKRERGIILLLHAAGTGGHTHWTRAAKHCLCFDHECSSLHTKERWVTSLVVGHIICSSLNWV